MQSSFQLAAFCMICWPCRCWELMLPEVVSDADKVVAFVQVGQAASYAAMAVGAGVLLSAMAIDVTDAALASAVVAAGAPEHLIQSLLHF